MTDALVVQNLTCGIGRHVMGDRNGSRECVEAEHVAVWFAGRRDGPTPAVVAVPVPVHVTTRVAGPGFQSGAAWIDTRHQPQRTAAGRCVDALAQQSQL
ncbi:hypothetical protein BIU87_05265 [Streptomyces sp. ZS0098]|nr:hypothetical protein BIU87_05265 [Streptomyces sp. ZS0098]